MNRHRLTCAVFLAGMLIFAFTITASAQRDEKPKPLHAPVPLPGVEPEMLTPQYWISLHKDADELIKNPTDIAGWNTRLRTKKLDMSDKFGRKHPLISYYELKRQVGLYMHPILPLDQPATLPGDSLRTWIGHNLEWVGSRDFYDGRIVRYNEEMIHKLEKAMNLDAIPSTIKRRYGVIVERGDIRLFPTFIPGFSSERGAMDLFQNTSIYMTVPVTILHESTDGDYYYVESPVARGWIDSGTVARGAPSEIRKLISTDNILMVTGNKVPVYGDRECTAFRQYLYFSGYVPFVKKTDGGYVVKMPERRRDGTLGIAECYLKSDADVSIGFLPYTKRNIITQIFKLLHQPYGWADQLKNRDCSGTMRVLYRCFGFTMGRWPNFQLLAPPDENIHFMNRSWSEEEKIAEAAKIEPFVTIVGSGGHVALWLGRAHNGRYYFLHQGGWGYNEGDQHYYVNQVNINDVTHTWYNIRSTPVFSTIK